MKKTIRLTLLFIILMNMLPAAVSAENFVSAFHPDIRYVGRYTTASGKYVRFSYPGFQIRAVFSGTGIRAKMKPDSGYYMVEIDDRDPFKVHFPKEDSVMTVVDGLPDGEHTITMTFATEGLYHRPQFWGFLLDDGCGLTRAPRMPQRKIEFIGNSITCGFGNEGKSGKEKFAYATENQYYTYGAITSRKLDAQCFVVARSGIGIYRNCGGNVNGDREIMPRVYPYTLFGMTGEKWDFSRFTPDVVCINLGTNDTSGSRYRKDLFFSSYWDFLQTVRSNYPHAKIVLLSGTMIRGGSERDKGLRMLLDELRQKAADAGDSEVYRFDMTPEDGTMGWGSCYHPSLRRHARMAEELTAFIRKITGWE